MVIKDIIYIIVVSLFTLGDVVACCLEVESVPRRVRLMPLDLSTKESVVACRHQVESVPRGAILFYA